MNSELIKKVKTGVYYAAKSFPIDSRIVDFLLEETDANNLNLARICIYEPMKVA